MPFDISNLRRQGARLTVRFLEATETAQRRIAQKLPPRLIEYWHKTAPHRGEAFRWSEKPAALGVLFSTLSVSAILAQAPLSALLPDLTDTEFFSEAPISNGPGTATTHGNASNGDSSSKREPSLPLTPYRIKSGEGFVDFLKRTGVPSKEAYQWAVRLEGHIDMRRLKVGARFDLAIDANGSLLGLDHRLSFDRLLQARAMGDDIEIDVITLSTERRLITAQGTIETSLYKAAAEAGLSDAMISAVAEVLAFDVDFQRDLRPGDQFTLYYDQYTVAGYQDDTPSNLIKDGRPLYLEITVNGAPVEAIWYEAEGIKSGYFAKDGRSTRKALMKTPIDGARLSSRFGKRRHPVLGYTRMHKGVDFAAPVGTPIKAAGDGVIDFIGRNGSFGNFVRIRHGGIYMTSYAHLTRFGKGLKKGSKVTQGQIIGTLGATGLVTGPHLHYEVYKNGKQVDPTRLKLPEAQRLKGPAMDQFLAFRQTILKDVTASLANPRYANLLPNEGAPLADTSTNNKAD